MRSFSGLLFCFILAQSCIAGTINVPGDSSTIQGGIDGATFGDTVLVASGTYFETIQMKDSVVILGAGAESTVIDGGGEPVVVTSASGQIEGFTIRNGDYGISYDGTSSPFVSRNIIKDCYYGVRGYIPYQEGPITPYIQNNLIISTLCCIWLDEQAFANGGFNGKIENNTLLAADGALYNRAIVYRMHQSLPIIDNNIITGSKVGIEFVYNSLFEERKALISCNDVWGNNIDYFIAEDEDTIEMTGIQGNISANPLFCDAASGDYTIQTGSQCAPNNNDCNILIGAFDVSCSPLCGDANSSGGIDIDDVVFVINYIFGGGPAPDPYESGDANCSGAIDIDDVVYLINYIFGGGSAPCDPDGNGVPDC